MNRTDATTQCSDDRMFDRFVIPNYKRFPVCLVRGEGSYVWDAEGNRYLDLFPGWGCNILGYSPPPVVRAIQAQVAELIHVPNTWYTEAQGEFAELLCTRGFGQAFFCNSGAEAVEAAIKLARLHGEGALQDHHVRKQFPRPHARSADRDGAAQISRGARAAGGRFPLRSAQRSGRGQGPDRRRDVRHPPRAGAGRRGHQRCRE